jgi:predicted transcriptional regulator
MEDVRSVNAPTNVKTQIIELAADIVSAYVGNNSVPLSELSKLIGDVHAALARIDLPSVSESAPESKKPAVSARRSIQDDYLVCLEDGKHFKSLRRHLSSKYDLTPEQYREKWSLPPDYPMVAPNYAKARSKLAKEMGLGQQRKRKKKAA